MRGPQVWGVPRFPRKLNITFPPSRQPSWLGKTAHVDQRSAGNNSKKLPKDSKIDKSLLILNRSLGRPEEVPSVTRDVPKEAWGSPGEVPFVQTIQRSPRGVTSYWNKNLKMDKCLLILNRHLGRPEEVLMKFLEVPSVQTIQRSPRLPKDSKMDKSLRIVNLSLGRPEEVPVSPGRYPWRPGEVLMKFQEVPSVQTI